MNKKKIFDLLEDIGWRFKSYQDFIDNLPIHREILNIHYKNLDSGEVSNGDIIDYDLLSTILFAFDLVSILESESE